MCDSTRHQSGLKESCQYCGLPGYKKPLLDDILIENDKLQSINIKFGRFGYPDEPDIFTLKLKELSNFISADEYSNQLSGSLQIVTDVTSINPTIRIPSK